MDFLTKDEPLINLNGFESGEEGEDLVSEEIQTSHQRRLGSSQHNASLNNRHIRISSGSKAYTRELLPISKEQIMEHHNSTIVSAVERTMKNYADGVLRVLEGMSGRLSQLESISQELENSVTLLRHLVEENYENTDQNFRILNDRTIEMHRSVQILRDKQDILEAHALLEKLQISKALAEKESSSGLGSTESHEAMKGYQQKDHALQEQSQESSAQTVAFPSVMSQYSLSPQPVMPQEPKPLAHQYQIPNLQPQQLVPVQHAPYQETSIQNMHQISKAHVTPSEQVQYQAVPQQLQMQPMFSSPPPPPRLQSQQPEQGCYLPVQQHALQHGPSQPQLQGVAIQQTEQARYHSASQQREVQVPSPQVSVSQSIQPKQGIVTHQPIDAQQAIVPQGAVQAQQGPVFQHPPQLQQQSGFRAQGSYQSYGQLNGGQSYSSLASGIPSYAQGAYPTEVVRDGANFAPHQHPNSPHQSSQLPTRQSFYQTTLATPQAAQSSHDSIPAGNVSGPMTWNRQTALNLAPRLPTGQLVRADHSPEVSGIVDKVVAMGFPRDQVQAVIKRLAERNQSINMNMVVDILMNRSAAVQGGFVR